MIKVYKVQGAVAVVCTSGYCRELIGDQTTINMDVVSTRVSTRVYQY